jgi:glycosyltransferase involved in cell wall biosynthesis
MRVLHVGAGNLYGGLETVLVTLARCRTLSPGLESEFALCFAGRAEDELRAAGATVHRLGEVRVRRPLSILRARRTLRGLIERRGFDAVICHSPWSQAIFGPAVRAARAASIFWLHDVVAGRHWLERWAARTPPDLAICNSRFTATKLPRIYPRTAVYVLFTPFLPNLCAHLSEERGCARAELATPANATVLIQIGRMEHLKGYHVHLQALERLRHLRDWVCWIVGGPQRKREALYFDRLRKAAVRLNISDRVRFTGQRRDVHRLLAEANVYCQPNIEPESFGFTFIEALHAGLPVVTTAIGGALEIVDDSCGILVEPDDPDALAGALRRLIEDRELRTRLGAAGPARAITLCDPRTQMAHLANALSQAAHRVGERTGK